MAVAWPKSVKTHNLPRLIWAAKSSRGANFFSSQPFSTLHVFRLDTASQPRKNGRCLAKNSHNTQFATFNLGCKKFARRKRYSSQPIPLLHVFTASQSCKIDHCLAKNSQNTQFATFNFSCKKFARRKFFSSPALSHVIRLLRRPNYAKMAVAWTKKFKTHNLPRLIWAAKVCAAQTFFIPAISHVTRLSRRPNRAKMAVAWPKKVKTHNLPRLIWNAKISRGAKFFHPQPFPTLHITYGVPTTQNGRCLAKISQYTQFATVNLGCKKFARRKLFSSQPFSTLDVFYGVPTTQN